MSNEYEVGYCKPPKVTQFKKGQSGNPKGRPKAGIKKTFTIDHVLDQKLVVTEGGRRRKVTKREALYTQLVNMALKGDMAAFRILRTFFEKPNTVEKAPLPWNDEWA